MASRKIFYVASSNLTITLASLASSSGLTAGRQGASTDNTSNLYLDYALSGLITTGTSPTANTQIQVWVVAKMDDTNWPDVFDGTDANKTVTTVDMLARYGRLISTSIVTATSNVGYPFSCESVAAQFGGRCPAVFSVFVVHNTGVALNATAGNHRISIKPSYETIA